MLKRPWFGHTRLRAGPVEAGRCFHIGLCVAGEGGRWWWCRIKRPSAIPIMSRRIAFHFTSVAPSTKRCQAIGIKCAWPACPDIMPMTYLVEGSHRPNTSLTSSTPSNPSFAQHRPRPPRDRFASHAGSGHGLLIELNRQVADTIIVYTCLLSMSMVGSDFFANRFECGGAENRQWGDSHGLTTRSLKCRCMTSIFHRLASGSRIDNDATSAMPSPVRCTCFRSARHE